MQSTAVNANDRGLEVVVVALICLTFSILFLLTRLYIRWPWGSLLGRDDVLAAIAFVGYLSVPLAHEDAEILQIVSIAQTGVVLRARSEGLGRKIEKLESSAVIGVDKVRAESVSERCDPADDIRCSMPVTYSSLRHSPYRKLLYVHYWNAFRAIRGK